MAPQISIGERDTRRPGLARPAAQIASTLVFAILAAAAPAGAAAGSPSFGAAALFAHEQPTHPGLLQVNVICGRYREGNQTWTEWCKDDFVCGANVNGGTRSDGQPSHYGCKPGPALQRKMDEERAALERQQQEQLQQAARRMEQVRHDMQRVQQGLTAQRREQEAAIFRDSRQTATQLYPGLAKANPAGPHALPVPPMVPAPTAGVVSNNGHVGGWTGVGAVVCNAVTGVGCGQPPKFPQFPHGQVASRPLPRTPEHVQSQINNLVAVAIELPPDNPLRGQIREALNKMAKDNNLPLNFDDYLGTDKCPAPKITLVDEVNPFDLRWRPEDIPDALKQMNLCQGVTGDAYDKCKKDNYGKAVMWAEPIIGFLCRRQTVNTPADEKDARMDECAQRKFDNAWAARNGKVDSVQSGSMVEDGGSCKPPDPTDRQGLRDYLKALLAAAKGGPTPDAGPSPPIPQLPIVGPYCDPPKANGTKDCWMYQPGSPFNNDPNSPYVGACKKWLQNADGTVIEGPDKTYSHGSYNWNVYDQPCPAPLIQQAAMQRQPPQPAWGRNDKQTP